LVSVHNAQYRVRYRPRKFNFPMSCFLFCIFHFHWTFFSLSPSPGFGPFSALYFVFYERFKSFARDVEKSESLSLPYLISSSALAGALASFLTSPLDLAKLRLQVQRGGGNGDPTTTKQYRGVVDCLQHAYRQGGIPGLFRGAGTRVLHFVPATSKYARQKQQTWRLFTVISISQQMEIFIWGPFPTVPPVLDLYTAITMTTYESMRSFFHGLLFVG